MKATHTSIIKRYLEDHPEKSIEELVPLLQEEDEFALLKRGTLVRYVQYVKRELSQVSIEAEEEQPWQVVDGNYEWSVGKDRHFSLSVATIDQLFFEYSKHGLDMGQSAVMLKHGLKPWQWMSIKNRLQLVKLGNIFSPYTLEQTPLKDREKMIEAKMTSRFSHTGILIDQQFTKTTNKRYLEVIKEADKNTFLNEFMLLELEKTLNKRQVVRLPQLFNIKHRLENITATLADLHTGACVEGLSRTADYNRQILRQYLSNAADAINDFKAKNVTLFSLGDLIESWLGTNHANSWKGMERGAYGHAVIEAATEELEIFLEKVRNVRAVKSVGGNHDRGAGKKDEDTSAAIARTIWWAINRSHGKFIDICHKNDVNYVTIDRIRYILSHGHLGITGNEKKAQKLMMEYGDNKLFTLLLTGHIHTRRTLLDGARERWMSCPSIFTGNEYSEQLGYDSSPGIYVIYDHNGMPRVIDEPLGQFKMVA